MVDALGSIFTVAGGAGEGAGNAMQNDALIKLKSKAMELREERIATLRNRNSELSDERASAEGLLEREFESGESAKDRESREKIAADKDGAGKGYNALDMVKEYNDSYNRNLKTLSGDGMLEIDSKMQEAAEKMTDRQFKRMGLPIPKGKPEPKGGGDDVSFDSLDAATKAINSVGNPDMTEAEMAEDVPVEEKTAAGGLVEPDNRDWAGPAAVGSSLADSARGVKTKVGKWAEGQRARFEEGGRLSDNARGFSGTTGDWSEETVPEETLPQDTPPGGGLLAAEPRSQEPVRIPDATYNGKPIYQKGDDYYVLDHKVFRKLTPSEVQEWKQVEAKRTAKK